MMNILGSGGFTSYIVDRVRNDEVCLRGRRRAELRQDGSRAFVVYALSKSETTCRATDLLLEQSIASAERRSPTRSWSRGARRHLNSRAFDFDSSEEIVSDFMDLVYTGFPKITPSE
jgi:hypothetical protein